MLNKLQIATAKIRSLLISCLAALSKLRTNGEIVVYPQPDGSLTYGWKGGALVAIKLDFLEMEAIAINDGLLTIGSFELKVVGFDEETASYLCIRVSADLSALESQLEFVQESPTEVNIVQSGLPRSNFDLF